MFVFGLLIVSTYKVLSVLANDKARYALVHGRHGLVLFIGWSLILLGTLVQLVDGISN